MHSGIMQSITDVVEDEQLINVSCNVCKHYLSVTPVLIDTASQKSVCGRCQTSSALFQHNKMFEVLAKQFTFPCVYSTEGCITSKQFEEIGLHEKSCTYRVVKCHCSWYGNPFEFITHYEEHHKELVIKDDDRITIEEEQKCFLFRGQGAHFLVHSAYNLNLLRVTIVGLSNASRESKAVFTCKLLDSDSFIKIDLDTATNISCKTSLCRFQLKVELPMEFLNDLVKRIMCPNCSVQMTPPILRCARGHLTCVECTDAWFDYCKVCNNELDFTCDTELECIAVALQFPCKWNCGNTFPSYEIREHELACEKRVYTCWHSLDCNWTGYLNELLIHDMTCLANIYEQVENCLFTLNIPQVYFMGTLKKRTITHLIVYNCCFNVIYDVENGRTSVHFNHYDIYAFSWFNFEVDLSHMEDFDCPHNKTYSLRHTHGGIYSVDIPQDDILKFGGPQFYKVVARVILLNEEERKRNTNSLYQRFKNYRRL